MEDPLLQVCTEKDLSRIAKHINTWESFYVYLNVTGSETSAVKENYRGNYEQQKVEVLKLWKCKKGPQATFKVLADVFSKELNDQGMVDTIKNIATVAFEEPSEDWVIEHYQDIERLGVDNLQAAISRRSHMITDAYSETLAVAANERKKLDVIVAALSDMVKQELMLFLEDFKSEIIQHVKHHAEEQSISKLSPTETAVAKRDSASVAVSPSVESVQRTKLSGVDKKFRLTVKNIKSHLEQCDAQDLVTDLNMSANDIPYFSDEVKKKLHKCKTIKDLFVRLSPYISWCKRDVLRVLVEVSDCEAAVDELNEFEDWLDTSQSIIHYPIPQASSSICPDPNSDITMFAIKTNKALKALTYKEVEQYQDTIAEKGGTSSKAFDLQANNHGSSILYWLIPKSVVKSFEANIRNNLDYLYDQGIVEILLDPNIVITTGRKLRVRSLSYLTKIPPPDVVPPQRAEELQELPTQDTELPERAEDIVELAYQLKIDMRKRMEEIKELDNEVKHRNVVVKKLERDKEEMEQECKKLERDKEEKEQECKKLERDKEEKERECNHLKKQLDETVQENEELKQIVQVSTQSSKEDTIQEATHGVHSAQHVNLSFGIRGHTAVYCGGKVYIGGGVVSNCNGAPDVIQVVDISTQCVSHLPPCPVRHFTLVSISNQVVTVGGKTTLDDQVTNKLYCWSEATQQWEERFPPMSTPRQFHTSVMWNNYLIVCGGRVDNDDSITDNVEILNLQAKRWHSASSLPLKESGKHAVITDRGKLYLLGGQLGNAVHYCKLQKLVASIVTVGQPKEASVVWRRLEDTPSTDCAAVLLRGSLVLIGGRNHETKMISSSILRYSNGEWQHIGDLLFGRTACMAVSLNKNTVLVTGGNVRVSHDQQPDWFSASTEIVTAS